MTTLPHRPLADDALWEKRNGRLPLLVEPGFLYEGESSVRYGVPYGSRARLLMFYLQTEALKTRSRGIRLRHSMTDWMGRVGINPVARNFTAVRNPHTHTPAHRP